MNHFLDSAQSPDSRMVMMHRAVALAGPRWMLRQAWRLAVFLMKRKDLEGVGRDNEPLLNSIRSGNYGGSDSHVFSRTRPGSANLDIFGHRLQLVCLHVVTPERTVLSNWFPSNGVPEARMDPNVSAGPSSNPDFSLRNE